MSVPVVFLGPEEAFRLSDLRTDLEHVSADMPTGAWLADRHGTPLAGSLGVLVDNVLGYSLNRDRPPGTWSVSGEISLEIVRPLDFADAAGPLHATTVGGSYYDDLGGVVAGTVTDARGDAVVICSQRGRWIPMAGGFGTEAPPSPDVPDATCVEDLLGATPVTVDGGATLDLRAGPVLSNPLGNLHGGISLCASDLVASAAVGSWATPWLTESLRIQFLRPVPAGSAVEYAAVVRHAGRTRAVVDVAATVADRLCTLAHVTGRPA